jgi:4-amino-4-deoxy-L-arabinose transferase-like glycosyltransferase
MSTPVRTANVAPILTTAPPRPGLLRGVSESTPLWPLISLFAVFPGLFSLAHRSLTDEAALWNLRAIDVLAASDFSGWFAPGSATAGPENALATSPPLVSWISALSLGVLGRYPSVALALPSYLFGAGIVVMTYLLGSLLLSRAAGFLGSMLVAGCAPLLLQIQTPLPHTAVVFTALASLYCHVRHLQAEATHYSRWVPLGGIAWGLCLLAGGAVAMVVPVIMALHLFCIALRSEVELRRALWNVVAPWQWPPLAAAWLCWLTGLVVGGWWHFYMWEAYGPSFGQTWSTPTPGGQPAGGFPLTLVPVMPATLVLAVSGTARAIKASLVEEQAREGRLGGHLLLTLWVCVAAFVLLQSDPHSRTVRLALVVPLLLLAADTLVALAQRTLTFESGSILVVATAAVVGLWATATVQQAILALLSGASLTPADWLRVHLFLDLVLIASLAAWFGYRRCLLNDRRQRLVIACLIGSVVGFSWVRGLIVTHHATDDDRQLAHLGRLLASAEIVERVTLVTDEAAPPLLSTLRGRWPRLPFQSYPSWDAWSGEADLGSAGVVVHWSRLAGSPTVLLPEGYSMELLGDSFAYRGSEMTVFQFRSSRRRATDADESGTAPGG